MTTWTEYQCSGSTSCSSYGPYKICPVRDPSGLALIQHNVHELYSIETTETVCFSHTSCIPEKKQTEYTYLCQLINCFVV